VLLLLSMFVVRIQVAGTNVLIDADLTLVFHYLVLVN